MQFEPNDLSELDELTEEHLGFSALSDGLGFSKTKGPHPATTKGQTPARTAGTGASAAGPAMPAKAALPSIELDEEDEQQLPSRQQTQGTGAVAGGPIWSASAAKPTSSLGTPVSTWGNAQGVYPDGPQRPMPPSSAPNALQAKASAPSALPSSPRPFNAITPAGAMPSAASVAANRTTTSAVAPTAAAQVLAEPAAPQGVRVMAFLLDALIILVPLTAAWLVSFGADAKEIFLLDRKPPLLLFTAIFTAYFLLSESFGGQSLGKMAFHLHVVEDDKYQKPTGLRHAALRMLLLIVGTACAGLGLLASFWDAKRRPWQDRYSSSIVRRKA